MALRRAMEKIQNGFCFKKTLKLSKHGHIMVPFDGSRQVLIIYTHIFYVGLVEFYRIRG